MKRKSLKQLFLRALLTLVSQLGSSAFAMGLSLFVFQKTDSALSFGLNMIAAPLATVVLSPVLGKVVDKYNHKMIIVLGEVASIAILFLYYFIAQHLTYTLILLTFLVVIGLKVADEFVLLSLTSSSINIVLEEHQQKLRSWQQIAANISGVLSPILGAVLYSLIDFNYFIVITIFSEFLSLLLVLLLDFELFPHENLSKKEVTIDFRQLKLFDWLSQQLYLKCIVILATVVSSVDTVIYIAVPIIALKILKISQFYYSLSMAFMVAGELVASLIISQKKKSSKPLKYVYLILSVSTIILIFLALAPCYLEKWVAFIVISFSLFGLTFIEAFYIIPLQVWYVTEIPEKIQGRVFAFINAIISFFVPFATIIFGVLYEIPVNDIKWLNFGIIALVVFIRCTVLIYLKCIRKIDFAKAKIL